MHWAIEQLSIELKCKYTATIFSLYPHKTIKLQSFVLKKLFSTDFCFCSFSVKCCQTHLLRVNRLQHPQFDLFVSSNSIFYVFSRLFSASRCLFFLVLKQCAKISFIFGNFSPGIFHTMTTDFFFPPLVDDSTYLYLPHLCRVRSGDNPFRGDDDSWPMMVGPFHRDDWQVEVGVPSDGGHLVSPPLPWILP